MIRVCKPKKVAIFLNPRGLTAAQVKAETGADAVINGGAFDGDRPVAHLKVNGAVQASENWGTPNNTGYGWNEEKLVMTDDMSGYTNFISCVCMIEDGQPVSGFEYPPDMGHARQRTAIGLLGDGRLWLCADRAVPRTPEQLRDYALGQGCVSAVMLDGGASTQCAFPDGSLAGGRPAQNYICVWEQKEEPRTKIYLSPSSQPNNRYAVGDTNEQVQCRRIAAAAQQAFVRCGFDCIVGDAEIDFTGRVAESNRWKADFHIPIHTNAGGGHGVVCFVYKDSPVANAVYEEINSISPYKSTYGVRVDRTLYEVKNTTASCVYVEAAFHDNAAEAGWIINHASDIGEAICRGVCRATAVKYVEPAQDDAPVLSVEERLAALEAWARTKGY